jgi:AcrR family transcriptional regulator
MTPEAEDGAAAPGASETRAERRRARVRSTIADTALRLFMSQGYDATTVEDVAIAVDMSPRTVFRYFPFKEDMLREALHFGLGELIAALRACPATDSPAQALGNAVKVIWAQDDKDPEEIRALLALIADVPRIRGLLPEASRTSQEDLADALAHRLGMPPTDLVTRVAAASALATLNVVLETWATMPAGTDLTPLLDSAIAELGSGPLRRRTPADHADNADNADRADRRGRADRAPTDRNDHSG